MDGNQNNNGKNFLKVPSRPAPPPPAALNASKTILPNSVKRKDTKGDKYIYQSIPRSRSTSDISGKKLPPPRPPPPRLLTSSIPSISNNTQQKLQQQSIKIKLPGFKSRKNKSQRNGTKQQFHTSSWHMSQSQQPSGGASSNKSHPMVGSLIDLQLSPTTSSRYDSSDDSSVDSFDSGEGRSSNDATASSTTPYWNNVQAESGFEDDFERTSTPGSLDPWSDLPKDPFSPQRKSAPILSGRGGILLDAFEISNEDKKSKGFRTGGGGGGGLGSLFPPTIIRSNKMVQDGGGGDSLPGKGGNFDEFWQGGSPPMPKVPPPPPPPEVLDVLANGPKLPPRPSVSFNEAEYLKNEPYCLALYDYTGEQDGDLSFKEGEKISLKRYVNEEWIEGAAHGITGIFPACFVSVVNGGGNGPEHENTPLIALYDFHPETWDDLELREGDFIKKIGPVNEDWTYGDCNGKRGQFPNVCVAEYDLDL